ncbi:MAG: sigma-70 family RNA polymerase sigma factor [bacterium]|nr:sigma-70 family RNA polymerase sigma factor [Candidatus Limimorpha equi]
MTLPIPYPRIKNKDDHQVVALLLKHTNWATDEFLYGKSYPIFKALYRRFYTDCPELLDFIHDIYIDIIEPRKQSSTCKLETFTFRSTLNTWMGVVSTRFCYSRYKDRILTESLDDSDRKMDIWVSTSLNENLFDMEDLNKMLSMMTNDRYRGLIRRRYVEGKTNEETAAELNLSMDVYYNKHRLAKVQFINVLREEGLL